MWRLALFLVLLLAASASADEGRAPHSFELLNVVNDVNCNEWEKTGEGAWIAQGTAVIQLVDGHNVVVNGVIVRAKWTDLYWTLEGFCRAELDGGL